jgi:hypothetical protein
MTHGGNPFNVGVDVFTAFAMNNAIFCGVMLCSLEEVY